MNRTLVSQDKPPAWPGVDRIVLVITDATRYNDAIAHVAGVLTREADEGVFITANRPAHLLRPQLNTAGVDTTRLYFVDCVSGMTGTLPPRESDVMHIESPTFLEKIAMRAEQVLRHKTGRRFLILDSLSTLGVYNGVPAVAELVHGLVTRLRLQGIGGALVLVERQTGDELVETVEPLCDNVVRY